MKQRESNTPRKNANRSLRSRLPYDDITRRRRNNKGGRRSSLNLKSESQTTTSTSEGTLSQKVNTVGSIYQDPSGPHPLPIVSVPVPVPPSTDHEAEPGAEDLYC